MADSDRAYRKAFYGAVNLHQGNRSLSEEEELHRYHVPIYFDVEDCSTTEVPVDGGSFLKRIDVPPM